MNLPNPRTSRMPLRAIFVTKTGTHCCASVGSVAEAEAILKGGSDGQIMTAEIELRDGTQIGCRALVYGKWNFQFNRRAAERACSEAARSCE